MKKLFLLILFVQFISVTFAQMSDDQVVAMVKEAQNQGKTQQQIIMMLGQKGVTQEQLIRIKNNYTGKKSTAGEQTGNGMSRLRQENPPAVNILDSLNLEEDKELLFSKDSLPEIRIFGRNIFNNKQLTFEPNLNIATPENYVLGPGDEIIVPEPAYANYMAFAISAGAKIRTIATTIEEGFSLPKVEKFEELINERTKAILICNPNNPTGYLYTRREMNQIRDLVKKYDLFLFSDEVYREFIYTGSPYISACHLEGIENNVVLIDSVSKRYSECGIRIGALITKNKEIRDAVMKFCQARLSPPLIGQIAAEASLDAPEEYSRETYDEYVERRKCLIDGLNRIPGVYSPIPMGAFYTVAKLPVDDSDKFCAWCLSDFEYEGQTVFMAPASGFYTTPGSGINEVRIAYVLKKEDLTRALFVLQKALEAYPGRTE